ncbi:unnamed protein product [Heligmosomoides polygyrus]|uniref:Transposase n=1 Tax=Heligmosomoides polygyrus TaxID=6339 RepID=A0A183GEE5_HELPZ|nr:unnamed protein product [Heligmosomoides polygyrus]
MNRNTLGQVPFFFSRKLAYLSFDDLGYASVFLRGEGLPLHEGVVKTYYNTAFSHRFDELKGNLYGDAACGLSFESASQNVGTDKSERRIVEKAGFEEVALRRIASRQTDKESSREEIKLAERMASILKDFEARQLEVDEDEQLEITVVQMLNDVYSDTA